RRRGGPPDPPAARGERAGQAAEQGGATRPVAADHCAHPARFGAEPDVVEGQGAPEPDAHVLGAPPVCGAPGPAPPGHPARPALRAPWVPVVLVVLVLLVVLALAALAALGAPRAPSGLGGVPAPRRGAAGARNDRKRRLARVNTTAPSSARKTNGCQSGPSGS